MTSSQVRGKSDELDSGLVMLRKRCEDAKIALTVAEQKLTNYPTQFQDYTSEVNGYIPTGIDEELSKDRLAKQITEFQELKVVLQVVNEYLGNITEF